MRVGVGRGGCRRGCCGGWGWGVWRGTWLFWVGESGGLWRAVGGYEGRLVVLVRLVVGVG